MERAVVVVVAWKEWILKDLCSSGLCWLRCTGRSEGVVDGGKRGRTKEGNATVKKGSTAYI